jgi:hypothetical protein
VARITGNNAGIIYAFGDAISSGTLAGILESSQVGWNLSPSAPLDGMKHANVTIVVCKADDVSVIVDVKGTATSRSGRGIDREQLGKLATLPYESRAFVGPSVEYRLPDNLTSIVEGVCEEAWTDTLVCHGGNCIGVGRAGANSYRFATN